MTDTSKETCYLIRKQGYWYRPNSQGYTSSAVSAGRYTKDEAENITHPNGPNGPRDGMHYVHVDDVVCDDLKAFRALSAKLEAVTAERDALRSGVVKPDAPDWEGFGRAVMAEHFMFFDLEGGDRQELAVKYNLVKPVEGGFNPELHEPDNEFGAEEGDPWFKFNFTSDRTPLSASSIRDEVLEEAISAVGKHLETPIDHDDGLYQRGVKDAISAIRALILQEAE